MKEKFKNLQLRMALIGLCSVVFMYGLTTGSVLAHEAEPHPHAEDSKAADEFKHPQHGSLGQIGAKLANPLSELWSLQFNLQAPQFYDGDVNTGDPQLGANMIF